MCPPPANECVREPVQAAGLRGFEGSRNWQTATFAEGGFLVRGARGANRIALDYGKQARTIRELRRADQWPASGRYRSLAKVAPRPANRQTARRLLERMRKLTRTWRVRARAARLAATEVAAVEAAFEVSG